MGDSGTGRRPDVQARAEAPIVAGDGEVAQLSKLAELHEAGALTDAELAAAKARLLGDT
jgi:hypothetical protein